jgi:hypothetical protein
MKTACGFGLLACLASCVLTCNGETNDLCPALRSQTNKSYSDAEVVGMAAELSKQSPESVLQSFQVLKEAGSIFCYMLCSNLMPSTSTNDISTFAFYSDPPSFTNHYPLRVKGKVNLKNTPARLHVYIMEKAATNMQWRIVSGWLTDTNEARLSELKLPTDADERQANGQLPKLLDEWKNDEQGASGTRNPIGETPHSGPIMK